MDKKTIGIITVVITSILCCLPGLVGLCLGSLAFMGAVLPSSGLPAEDTTLVIGSSIMILGLSLIFIAIPIGIGIWFWRSHEKEAAIMETVVVPEEDF